MERYIRLFALLSLLAMIGCTRSTSSVPVESPASSTDVIKSALQSTVDSGMIDSGLVAVEEELQKLKETDAAKAEALLKDLEQLKGMSDPGQIKAKAKEMIGKL